jgi:hypothetical protein
MREKEAQLQPTRVVATRYLLEASFFYHSRMRDRKSAEKLHEAAESVDIVTVRELLDS